MFGFAAVFPVLETNSPGLAVPEVSTITLVLPGAEGLKGVGPEEVAARSQGFGGGLLPDCWEFDAMAS